MEAYPATEFEALGPPARPAEREAVPEGPIPEGERDNWLTSQGGRLRRGGASQEAIDAALQALNAAQCDPPLDEREVQGIARSVSRYEAGVIPAPLLSVVDMADVMTADLEPPDYIMEPWLPRRLVTLLAGHGGLGKSYLAEVIAAHGAAGATLAGKSVEQCKVLFVSLEDEPRLVRWRLRQIIQVYHLDAEKVLANVTLLDGTEQYAPLISVTGEGANAKPKFTRAYDTVREHATGYDLIIIDNASDAFDANENTRRHVRQFVHGLAQIARDSDSSVLLLAHIDKNAAKGGAQGNSYSGSTAWHNSCRSRIALVKEDEGVLLRHEKNNLGPCADDVPVDIQKEGGVPWLHEPLPMQEQQDTDRDVLLEIFDNAKETIPAKVTPGNGSAMQALETVPGYPKRFQSRDGKRRVGQLITKLLADGTLKKVEYRDKYRNQRERLELSTNADDARSGVTLVRK